MAADDVPESGPTGKFQVADPEEFNQQQRLAAINRARQRVEDTLEQTEIMLARDPEFSEHDRERVVRAVVYSYLTNIEWLVEEASSEPDEEANEADEILYRVPLGKVTVFPPDELVELVKRAGEGYPRIIGEATLTPRTFEIRGLHGDRTQGHLGYLTAPDAFEGTWSLQVERRHEPPQTLQRTASTGMDVDISRNAYRVANRFLRDSGIDVNLEEEQHRVVIDRKIIEEVDEWRKENIKS